MNLQYTFNSGKNSKWKYYLKAYFQRLMPNAYYRRQLESLIKEAEQRQDMDYILDRVEYYCKLGNDTIVDSSGFSEICRLEMTRQKVYWIDAMEYLRYFDPHLKVKLRPGDITDVQPQPAICKTRPLIDDNANNVLLSMDKVRHFIFVDDKMTYDQKRDKAQFRGKLGALKSQRTLLLETYFGHPLLDLGAIPSSHYEYDPAWLRPKLTLYQQLENKFILSIEGNDVASNLKWVMSSNSIAVMPQPTVESWFMEGRLVPNVHYVEVNPDFSDLPDRIQYYLDHPVEAKEIIDNAHRYVDAFRDHRREKLISLLTLQKYLDIVNR